MRGGDDRGSSPVEFVLVGSLLTVLTLAVLQLGLAVYVRNVLHDAAIEGAHYAALADVPLQDGADRTREIVVRAVGADFAQDVTIARGESAGQVTAVVTIRSALPVIGLIGVPYGLEVTGHAPLESLGPR